MTGGTDAIRIGIVGLGNAGELHLRAIADGRVPGARVTAVACRPARAAALAPLLAGVAVFDDPLAMCASGACDAVIIATPHPLHPAQSIAAMRAGLHVLCEKPAGCRASEARAMHAAAEASGVRYALNLSRRTVPAYARLRELVRDGTLGTVRRAAITSTTWLRAQSYYDASPWRGTWAGEGGGLLLNQLPHLLDVWHWTLGAPARVLGRCGFGRHHDVEVEDEVHAIAEYENGATATLVGSTGEAPGAERIEIVGDRATVVVEGEAMTLTRLATPVDAFIRDAPSGFDRPAATVETIRFDGAAGGAGGDLVAGVTRDFVARLRDGGAFLAPGVDGIASLELANVILLSHWDERWAELPLDAARFDALLAARQAASRAAQKGRPASASVVDLSQSFATR